MRLIMPFMAATPTTATPVAALAASSTTRPTHITPTLTISSSTVLLLQPPQLPLQQLLLCSTMVGVCSLTTPTQVLLLLQLKIAEWAVHCATVWQHTVWRRMRLAGAQQQLLLPPVVVVVVQLTVVLRPAAPLAVTQRPTHCTATMQMMTRMRSLMLRQPGCVERVRVRMHVSATAMGRMQPAAAASVVQRGALPLLPRLQWLQRRRRRRRALMSMLLAWWMMMRIVTQGVAAAAGAPGVAAVPTQALQQQEVGCAPSNAQAPTHRAMTSAVIPTGT